MKLGEDMKLGEELTRVARKLSWITPKFSQELARRLRKSAFLN